MVREIIESVLIEGKIKIGIDGKLEEKAKNFKAKSKFMKEYFLPEILNFIESNEFYATITDIIEIDEPRNPNYVYVISIKTTTNAYFNINFSYGGEFNLENSGKKSSYFKPSLKELTDFVSDLKEFFKSVFGVELEKIDGFLTSIKNS